ncbi:MAG TPA: PQQ-binding-like beta-propeller repeat protein, partial [Nitrospira sp.]|nr:PQQ-binding-like beta-propeller repeat protein [Nitrospira sp.]
MRFSRSVVLVMLTLCLSGCGQFIDGLAAIGGHGGEIAHQDAMQESITNARYLREQAKPPSPAWESLIPNETADLIRFVGSNRVLVGTLEVGAYLGVPDHGPVRLYDAETGRMLWEADRPSFRDGRYSVLSTAPVIVLMGSNEDGARLLALDPASGSLKWEHAIKGPYRSALTEDLASLIVTSPDKGDRTVYALNLTTGRTLWSTKLEANGFHDKQLAALYPDREAVFIVGRRLTKIDLKSGRVLWSVEHPILRAGSAMVSISSEGPILWNAKTLALLDGTTGRLRWSKSVRVGGVKLASILDDRIFTVTGTGAGARAEAPKKTAASSVETGTEEIQAWNLHTGKALWSHASEAHVVSPLIKSHGLLLYTSDDALVGIDFATGRRRFQTAFPPGIGGIKPSKISHALPDQIRISSDTLFVAREGAGIAAFNLPDGRILWSHSIASFNYSVPGRLARLETSLVQHGKAPAQSTVVPTLATPGPSLNLRMAQSNYEQARSNYERVRSSSSATRGERSAATEKFSLASSQLAVQEKMEMASSQINGAISMLQSALALNEALASALADTAIQGLIERLKMEVEGAIQMRSSSFQGRYFLQPFLYQEKGRGVMIVNVETGEQSDVVFAVLNEPLRQVG